MSHHRSRRLLTAALVCGSIGALAPATVFAHVEFEAAPATVAPDSDIPLTLHVANEGEGPDDFTVGVAVRLPEGWTGVSCEEKPTWTCEITEVSQRVEIHFDKDEGAAPAEDETFEFTLHSSATLGTATFPTLQTYSTSGEVGWVGDPDTEFPAPTLEVADPAAETTTTAAAPTTAATTPPTTVPATTLAPATTVAEATTTVESATTTTAATGDTTVDTATILESTPTTAAGSDSDGENTGLLIAILLLLAALAAAAIWYLRRRKPPVLPADEAASAVIVPGAAGHAATDPTIVIPEVTDPTVVNPEVADPTIENPDVTKPTDGSE